MSDQNIKKIKYIKPILISLAALALLIAGFYVWREKSKPADSIKELNLLDRMEAEGVPPIKAKALDGHDLDTEKLKGKVVIINFWASWCGPCVEEVPSLISLVEAFSGKVQLVAVSGDSSKEDIEVFKKSFPKFKNENIHILWDENHEIMNTYDVQRLPESFIVGLNGKLVKKIVGTINWHTPDSEAFVRDLLEKEK